MTASCRAANLKTGRANHSLIALVLLLCTADSSLAQKRKPKKDEEPKPQALAVVPETPDAITVETAKIAFQISPLSDKGLLSQQVRDGLKALDRQSRGNSIVKIRAFVAGSGDLRRVQEIVAEEFVSRKQQLPVVSTIQVGALPMVGAQVVLEATAMAKKPVNTHGVAFFSGVPAKDGPGALEKLNQAVTGSGVKSADVLRVTCFLSSFDQIAALRSSLTSAFPSAVQNLVQMQRLGIEPQAACEAVGRLSTDGPGTSTATVALVHAPKLTFTETQLAFRDQAADFRLAFQRLAKLLNAQTATPKDIVWMSIYALTRPNAATLEEVRWEFLDRAHPPAGTSLLFEGLPSTDATAAIEVMATRN